MRLPLEIIDLRRRRSGLASSFRWRISLKRSVNTFLIVIMPEISELSLEIKRVPKKHMIRKFSSNCSY